MSGDGEQFIAHIEDEAGDANGQPENAAERDKEPISLRTKEAEPRPRHSAAGPVLGLGRLTDLRTSRYSLVGFVSLVL